MGVEEFMQRGIDSGSDDSSMDNCEDSKGHDHTSSKLPKSRRGKVNEK